MPVKILEALTAGKLEKKVNKFIENEHVDIINVQMSTSFGTYAALIQYRDDGGSI